MYTCKDSINLLLDFLDGEIPPEEAKHLREHLSGCAPCMDFLRTYRATPGLCRRGAGPTDAAGSVGQADRVPARPNQVRLVKLNLKSLSLPELAAGTLARGAARLTAVRKVFASVFAHGASSLEEVCQRAPGAAPRRGAASGRSAETDPAGGGGAPPADDGFVKYLFDSPLGGPGGGGAHPHLRREVRGVRLAARWAARWPATSA